MRKDYKQINAFLRMEKKGQIAIFVVIALVTVAVIIAVFLFPNINVGTSAEVNPNSFLRECIDSEMDGVLEAVSAQGGSIIPDNYIMYQDDKIQYLCYTSEYYKTCVVQQPLLVRHVQNEIKKVIEPSAQQCLRELIDEYESKGYDVQGSAGELNVTIIPGKINVEFNAPLSVTKEGTQSFRKFGVSMESEIYDLLMTATSIVQFESSLGDSEPLMYIQYYPDLKIEKISRDDGTTIYRLSNVVSGDRFTFASRSLVFPAGYGLENQ